ncbi:MAG: hypothetical protein RL410_151, partial [Actinomycetota bacterium]
FNGQLPDFMQNQNTQQGQGNLPGSGSQGGATTGGNQSNSSPQPRPTGGFDGNGGSAFDITQFSVEGVETSVTAIGPMSSVTVSDGRLLNKEDIGQQNAVVDSAYATTNKIAVGDSISIASKKFTVVGIAQSTSTGANTASNVYIPIDVAQKLSGHTDEVTNVYVKANSAETVSTLDSALTKALPSMQVNSTSELASSVSGTLSSASSLIQDLGKWLSVIVLIVAFAIGALLTSSGVNRRTREFGTLKAIGWRSSRIVRQVMAESLATGFIGGIAGIGVGAAGVAAINHFAPTLTAQLAVAQQGFGPNGPNGGPGGFRGPGEAAQSISVVLNAVLSPSILLIALLLSILGGLVAGVFGGWRASRLSPAESLRSVA